MEKFVTFHNFIFKILSFFIINKKKRKLFRENHKKLLVKFDFDKNSSYAIISLGNNCLLKTVLTKNNLMKRKQDGGITLPFDLAVSHIEPLIYMLKTNFKDYFDGIFYNKKDNVFQNDRLKNRYNHDSDYLEADFDKFILRYKNRILNFQNEIKNANFIYFVLNLAYEGNSSNINNLYKTLLKIRNYKNFKLIVFDIEKKLDLGKINKEIYVFQKHHPFIEHSNWHKEGYFDSYPARVYFKLICDFIVDIIKKDFEPKIYL